MSFVNPYNFVRPGKAAKREPPVWHHKFEGHSGKIVCTLKTRTPIFIPDSEIEEKEVGKGKYHKIMKFYRVNGELRLPSTSLKGMTRSVAEAASNSCFSQFEEGRLDYRTTRIELIAGKVLSLPTKERLGEIQGMDRAWIAISPHQIQATNGRGVSIASIPPGKKNGDEIYIKIQPIPGYISSRKMKNGRRKPIRVPFNIVTHVSDTQGSGFKKGILKITEKTISNKKRERVFFGNKKVFKFNSKEKENYDYILKNQIERARREEKVLPRQSDELSVGDLIYFVDEGRDAQGNLGAKHLSRVEIPRIRYHEGRGDLLSVDYHPCSDIRSLCPACRIFGTVIENPPAEETEFKAFAGNIRFSEGKLLPNQTVNTRSGILRILSSPKPTSFNFYLKDPKNPEQVRNYDGQAIITEKGKINSSDVGKVVLRGRKFYWHQPFDESLKKYFTTEKELKAEKQGLHLTSTVELLQPSVEFEFAIEFENLKPEEIGILLWSLELEVGMAHKLGRGKPLGLGSVEINIKEFQIINRLKRYQEIFSDGVEDGNKKESISAFKHWLEKWNDNKPFDEIVNIKGLKSIMNLKNPPDDAVHYPRGGYQWFMYRKNEPLLNISDVERGKKQTR